MQPRPMAETSRVLPSLRFCMICLLFPRRSGAVLIVGDVFHPLDGPAVQGFLDCDVGHCGCPGGTVPMLFARLEPDDIARADLFDGTAQALHPARAGSDDERLTEGMRVPRGPGARFECHGVAGCARRC